MIFGPRFGRGRGHVKSTDTGWRRSRVIAEALGSGDQFADGGEIGDLEEVVAEEENRIPATVQ